MPSRAQGAGTGSSPPDDGRQARRPYALPGGTVRRSLALMGRGIASEPRIYVLAILASALFGGLTAAVAWALGTVTDDVVVPAIEEGWTDRRPIWVAGAALAGIALALGLSVAGRRIFAGIGAADIQAGHRRRVTRQYLRLPMSWHRAHPTGQLLANASSDVEAATGVFNPLPFALGVLVMIGVSAVALLSVDVPLALTALGILPLALLANVVFQRHMSPAATRAQQLRAEVADVAHESFEAAQLVKSLGTEDREERRFTARADALRGANVRVGTIRAMFDPVIDMLPNLGTLLVLLVGAHRAASGAVEVGDVVTASYLLTILAVPVRAFGWVLGELPRGLVGYDRIARVLDAEGELVPGTAPLRDSGPALEVRLERVSLAVPGPLGDQLLLDDVSLTIPAGRTVALVGVTGAGKTTLVSLLSRLQDPTSGAVLLDGVDVRDLRAEDLTAQVGLVPQQTFLFEDTVRANVTLADDDDPSAPDDDAVWHALTLARVDDVVRRLPGGLDAPLGERGANLSGGQRQRIAIARALVRRPRLLVLDDATSAVDPRIEQEILAGLRREADGSGPTVLMVAYRMSSVLLADQVVHLHGGRVVDTGTHAELMRRDAGYVELATAYEQETARRAALADEETEDAQDTEGATR